MLSISTRLIFSHLEMELTLYPKKSRVLTTLTLSQTTNFTLFQTERRTHFNPLPDVKNLTLYKSKAFADDNSNFASMAISAIYGVRKYCGKRRKFLLVSSKKITFRETICLMHNANFTSDHDSSGLLIAFMIEAAHCSLNISFSQSLRKFFFNVPGELSVAGILCYQKCNILKVKLNKS